MPHGRGTPRGYRPNPAPGQRRGHRGHRGSRGAPQAPHLGTHGHLGDDLVFVGDFQDLTPNILHFTRGFSSSTRGHRGHQSPRGFGRGRYNQVWTNPGISGGHTKPQTSFSALNKDRGFLRPIEFVRGENQKTLFEQVEDILHVPGEEGPALNDHVPSADKVERIFYHDNHVEEVPPSSEMELESTPECAVHAETEVAVRASPAAEERTPIFVVDTEPSAVMFASQFSENIKDNSGMDSPGDTAPTTVIDTKPNPVVSPSQPSEIDHDSIVHTDEGVSSAFVVDTKPSPVVFASHASEDTSYNFVLGDPFVGAIEDDVIVYEAPHPRSRRDTPAPVTVTESSPIVNDVSSSPAKGASVPHVSAPTPIDAVPISLVSHVDPDAVLSKQVQARKKLGLKPTPRSRKMAKKECAAARRREERNSLNMTSMISLGLSVQERAALQEGLAVGNDSRYAERRRGDSDIDWGTENESAVEKLLSDKSDMELDDDIGDITALASFAQRAEGLAGEGVVTIADLEDGARMREEDEVDSGVDSSDGDEENFNAEERKEIGETSDMDGEEDSSNAEPLSEPGSSSWADRDEAYLKRIHSLLDQNAHLLDERNRKARSALFKATEQDEHEFSDVHEESFAMYSRKKKDRHLPPELQEQWRRDRAKKAERKRIRALARMKAAADLPTTRKTSKRKEEVLGGARFRGDTIYVDRVSDMIVLENLIRNFLGNLEMNKMVLPPKAKEWRRRAHLVANAFHLKSKSDGSGEARFMTLLKTTLSGINLNEPKISRLINGNNGGGKASETAGKSARASRPVSYRGADTRREGEVVGKTAPRLSESNVGFKLLQQMGWEEGDRLGVTSGLVDPLTAIIKTTRRGLGAAR